MKQIFWVLRTELIQNKFHFTLVFAVSLVLGISMMLAVSANEKIAAISRHENWQVDLVVLPKGMSLTGFRDELVSGQTSQFLPEALFETTISLAKDAISLSAVLAITDHDGPRVLIKSNKGHIGVSWLEKYQRVVGWAEQATYSTPEWGNKVISGFFASGAPAAMVNLKELINRKTVAQALFVSEEQGRDEKIQTDFSLGLLVYSGVLATLIVLSLISLFFWIRARVANTLNVLEEMGFSNRSKQILVTSLLVVSCVFPILIGVGLIRFVQGI